MRTMRAEGRDGRRVLLELRWSARRVDLTATVGFVSPDCRPYHVLPRITREYPLPATTLLTVRPNRANYAVTMDESAGHLDSEQRPEDAIKLVGERTYRVGASYLRRARTVFALQDQCCAEAVCRTRHRWSQRRLLHQETLYDSNHSARGKT